MTSASQSLRSVFVAGLQNAHALEHQAISLIDRQLDRLVRYPEISDRLRSHRVETQVQIRRLDEILSSMGESHSMLKDAAMSMVGNFAALSHVVAPDEVLKNQFVNHAFEAFEIASYTSLITLADAGAFPSAAKRLEETLREEEAMAAWVKESLPALTRKYAGLREEEGTASH